MVDREAIMRRVRQPASAAVAGIIFAVILGTVILLLRSVVPELPADLGTWSEDAGRRETVSLALSLIPFAGIAFLWFIAVLRAQVGSAEDRFIGTVFLGSGLIFVAMLFAAAAALKAVLSLQDSGVQLPSETRAFGWALAAALLGSFGTRMAAVFIATAATAGRRSRRDPEVDRLLRLSRSRAPAPDAAAAHVPAVPLPAVGSGAERLPAHRGRGAPDGGALSPVMARRRGRDCAPAPPTRPVTTPRACGRSTAHAS